MFVIPVNSPGDVEILWKAFRTSLSDAAFETCDNKSVAIRLLSERLRIFSLIPNI